jgi:hypothetical protein
MNECIVCKQPMGAIEMALNMDFHPRCAPDIIKQAWDLLEKQAKKEPRKDEKQ